MKTRRFEFIQGSSKKFWEVGVEKGALVVCFGRIGSPGQKKIARPADPAAAAAKLIAEKLKKGYREKGAGKSDKVERKTKPTGPAPALVIEYEYEDNGFIAAWPEKKDLWIVGMSEAPKTLEEDATFKSALEDNGFVERWRFASPNGPATALKALKGEKRKPAKLPAWFESDFALFAKKLGKKTLPRIARFALAKSGPVTLHRHVRHPWLHPRPPSQCAMCMRVMVPTWSLSGAIDPRLGKKSNVYVSFCPGGLENCEAAIEVVVQSDSSTKPRAEHYFAGPHEYLVIVTSLQWNPIDASPMYVLTEHFGMAGTPGNLKSKTFASKKALDQGLKERLADLGDVVPSKPLKGYGAILDEMHHYHRHPQAKPKTMKLVPAVPAMDLQTSPYGWSRAMFEETDCVGGNPAYTQSSADDVFPCPDCKSDMLFVFQAGSGTPWWSEIVNDGDAGSFQFFACPKCKGPFGFALFECH